MSGVLTLRGCLRIFLLPWAGLPHPTGQVGAQPARRHPAARGSGSSPVSRPGPPGAEGGTHPFTLLPRPNYYGYRNFYIDQPGVTRATRDNRPATAHDPPVS